MSIPLARSRLKAVITLLATTRVPDSCSAHRRRLLSTLEECANEMRDLLNDAGHEARRAAQREFERKHTAACRKHQEDPGATCICRDWSDKTQGTR